MERGGQDGHGVLQIPDVTTTKICFQNKKLCKNTSYFRRKSHCKGLESQEHHRQWKQKLRHSLCHTGNQYVRWWMCQFTRRGALSQATQADLGATAGSVQATTRKWVMIFLPIESCPPFVKDSASVKCNRMRYACIKSSRCASKSSTFSIFSDSQEFLSE